VNLKGGDLYGVNITLATTGAAAFRGAVVGSHTANGGLHDVVLNGQNISTYGFDSLNPQGLVLERVVSRNNTDNCYRLNDNADSGLKTIQRMTDLVADVCRGRGVYPGTGEVGIFFGHPVAEKVDRLDLRRANYAGIVTVNEFANTTIEDLFVSDTGPNGEVAVYAEHDSKNYTVREFRFSTRRGFTHEWDQGVAGNQSTYSPTYEDGVIEHPNTGGCIVGIYFDGRSLSGTATIRRVTFEAGMAAAVSNHLPVAGAGLALSENTYNGNAVLNPGPHINGLC
jgi:hypothetical protein